VDPPTTQVRFQGREVLALGVSMAKGGDIIAWARRCGAVKAIERELPAGMTLEQVQDQPKAVSTSVGEFVHVLIEAVVIVLGVSFISLGLHTRPLRIDIWPGLVVAITIPLVLAITFPPCSIGGGPAQDLAGLADHRAGPAGGRRHHRRRDDGAQAGRGLRQAARRHLRLRRDGHAHADRHADHGGRLSAHRLAKSVTGEYTFAIFAVTAAALVISWVVSVYFVPYLGALLLKSKHAPAARRTSCSTRRSTTASAAW
jgi:multidrug efflux pump subunit AcrB